MHITPGFRRLKLTLEYDGTDFYGWQRLQDGDTVQQTLEQAITKFSGLQTLVYGAGRTDSGVHATGQVAHVDLPAKYSTQTVQNAINYHVQPKKVAVLEAEEVGPDFHARFSAIKRVYHYHILERYAPPILAQNRAYQSNRTLNMQAMQEAGNLLLGQHDFTSFRAQACQARSPLITLDKLELRRTVGGLMLELQARSFLHHMVRNIVGTLLQVGLGKWEVERMPAIIAARDRASAGPTMPPYGLYLHQVIYPATKERQYA